MIDSRIILYLKKNFCLEFLLKKYKFIPPLYNQNELYCLFHQSRDNPFIAHINVNNQFHCWSCAKNFDVFDIFHHFNKGFTFSQIVYMVKMLHPSQQYKQFISLINVNKIPSFQREKNKTLLAIDDANLDNYKGIDKQAIFKEICLFYHQQLFKSAGALNYLVNQRRIKYQVIKDFILGFAPKKQNEKYSYNLVKLFANRKHLYPFLYYYHLLNRIKKDNQYFYCDVFSDVLIFPVYNNFYHFYSHNFLRQITRFDPKYKTLPKVEHINIFEFGYGFRLAQPHILKSRLMIMHEGFFDVLTCFNHHIKNVIGLINISARLSDNQLSFLKRHNIYVFICLDNDLTGKKRNLSVQEELTRFKIPCTIKPFPLQYNDCKDVDELIKKYGLKAYIDLLGGYPFQKIGSLQKIKER